MKRFVLILAMLLPALVFADTTPRIYDAQRTKVEMKIDGKLTESSWNTVKYSEDFADIRGLDWPAPAMKTNVKILWDNECLYIGARLEEKNITGDITGRDEIIWKNNDFEVFLDPYGDGKLYYEIENNALGTVMDLLMEKPYVDNGVYMMTWDCKDLQLAVSYDGTLNNPKDVDKAWYVEMAVPLANFQRDTADARHNKIWRINFSRVEWPEKGGREENWVWNPTGKVDMHLPSNWGYLRFCDGDVVPPMPPARFSKNWAWIALHGRNWTLDEYKAYFRKAYECGICAILFEGYDEDIYHACKDAGLEAHYWLWTLNRKDLLEKHPDWAAVSRDGKNTHDNPPYVDYYRFLCPTHPGVADSIAADYLRSAKLKYVDGMHLDYVRFPDVVLPTALWSNYGIDQSRELPEYDFCYCDLCREEFKKLTGRDPLLEEHPDQDQSWLNFRYDAITKVVTKVYETLAAEHKILTAAVFPGPSLARRMVRQDWNNWPLYTFFPMTYHKFYNEGVEWIGRSVAESVKAVNGRAEIFPGLMYPDLLEGEDFEKALDQIYANDASGVSFFDGPDEAGLERFKKYIDGHNLIPDRRPRHK